MPLKCKTLFRCMPPQWFCAQGSDAELSIHGRGYAFRQGTFAEGPRLVAGLELLCRGLAAANAMAVLERTVPNLNGAWALIADDRQGRILAAVDRIRSIPVFYAESAEGILVSPSIELILSKMSDTQVVDDCALEFLLAGYVTGRETLYKGVYQLRPGEMLFSDGDKTVLTRYYRFLPEESPAQPQKNLERQLEGVLDDVFSRVAASRKGTTFLLPLGGGMDSRLIAGMLRRHGHTDVVCFSYGRSGNKESSIGEQVARSLGYEWRFIPYNQGDWPRWIESPEMKLYWKYSAQCCSLPHVQDFPAVRMLLRNRNPSDVVFVPGHTGMLSGGRIPPGLHSVTPRHDLATTLHAVLRENYALWGDSWDAPIHRESLLRRIIPEIPIQRQPRSYEPSRLYEAWDFENRQARFIVNSVRAYEFFGAPWTIPLCDYELMNFLLSVPSSLRFNKELWLATMTRRIFVGPLAPLAAIPLQRGDILMDPVQLARQGPSRPARTTPTFKALRRIRHAGPRRLIHFLRPLWWRYELLKWRRSAGSPLLFEEWFSGGKPPDSQTVRDAFRRKAVLLRLPDFLVKPMEPVLNLPLPLAPCNGLLAAFYLADEISTPRHSKQPLGCPSKLAASDERPN